MIDTTACLGPAGQLDDREEHGGVSTEELPDFLHECRHFFASMVQYIKQLSTKEDSSSVDGAVRDVHSIKSLVAFARLDHLVHLCHILEEAIQDLPRREGASYSSLRGLVGEAATALESSFDALESGGLHAALPATEELTQALVESVHGARFGSGDTEFRIELPEGLREAMSGPARTALLEAMTSEIPVFEVTRALSADQALSLQWAAMAPGGMILARSLEVDDAFDGVVVRYLVLPDKGSTECPALPPDASSRSMPYLRRRQSGRDPAALRLQIDGAAETELRRAAADGEAICIVTVEFSLDDPIRAGRSQHAFEELQRIGTMYLAAPALESLRAGEEHGAFRVVMGVPGGGERIRSTLSTVAEDANWSVRGFVFTDAEGGTSDGASQSVSENGETAGADSSVALKRALRALDQIAEEAGVLEKALTEPDARAVAALEQIRSHGREIQHWLLETLTVPGTTLFSGTQRVAREVATRRGRAARVLLNVASELRLPRGLAMALRDPVHHLVRNAVDHGIEDVTERCQQGKPSVGTVQLSLWEDGDCWWVEVRDDGRGVDREGLRRAAGEEGEASPSLVGLMASAGVSTAPQVDEISGRGAGMGVVLAAVQRLDGEAWVESSRGLGTSIRIRIPCPSLEGRT
jgi:chemotaxis protein histidine kinase CheA